MQIRSMQATRMGSHGYCSLRHFGEHAEGATQRESMWLRELASRLLREVSTALTTMKARTGACSMGVGASAAGKWKRLLPAAGHCGDWGLGREEQGQSTMTWERQRLQVREGHGGKHASKQNPTRWGRERKMVTWEMRASLGKEQRPATSMAGRRT
jgi:hypothetical protein